MNLEQMMSLEGIEMIELDKTHNTATFVSSGRGKTSFSLDLLTLLRARAEKSDCDVYKVVQE